MRLSFLEEKTSAMTSETVTGYTAISNHTEIHHTEIQPPVRGFTNEEHSRRSLIHPGVSVLTNPVQNQTGMLRDIKTGFSKHIKCLCS